MKNSWRTEGRILVINSPAMDKGGFRGSPTSLLYAISPLVEAIKARPKQINITGFSHLNIFDPTYVSEDLEYQLVNKLLEIEPHIVAISTTSLSFKIAERMADIVKATVANAMVIIGGPHCDEVDFGAPDNPNNPLLSSKSFDFVISGDGEYMLLTLVRMIFSAIQKLESDKKKLDGDAVKNYVLKNAKDFKDVKGKARIYFKVSDKIFVFESSMKQMDLNELPPLRYEFLKKEHLKDFSIFRDEHGQIEKCVQVMTHRGCTGNCNFCSERVLIYGQTSPYYYTKKVEKVIDELWHYVDRLGVQAIFFDDSTFLENPTFVKELCRQMKDSGLSRRIRWGCLNRFDKVEDKELIKCMAQAGLDYMYLGLELMDDESLREMSKVKNRGKPSDLKITDIIRNALETLKDNNVRVGVSILFGLPYASEDVEKETIKFVGRMVNEKKIRLVSLSLFNYHEASLLSQTRRQVIGLDYFNVEDEMDKQNKPPWNCFEEGGWFHASNRLVDEEYLARLLWEVDRNIGVKDVLVRKAELEDFVNSAWGKRLLQEPEAFSLIKRLRNISLSDFTVVGDYVRYDEEQRKSLSYICRKILDGFSKPMSNSQYWLFWGPSRGGKTFFVAQIGEVAKKQGIKYKRLDLSDKKMTKDNFSIALNELEESGCSVLCFIDEIAGKQQEKWPFEIIKSFLDVIEKNNLPIIVVLAGSEGKNIDDLKNDISNRHMGNDVLKRLPITNEYSIPDMSVSDSIIIALSSVKQAVKSAKKEIKAVEKLALLWMALSPRLETAGQVSKFVTKVVERMPLGERSIMYLHLFDSDDPEKTRFINKLKPKNHLTELTEQFVNILD